jgi:hypothetical protein
MIGQTATLLRLRWLAILLFSLTCSMMGSAAALAQRSNVGYSSTA